MRSAYMGLGLYGFSGYLGNFWVGPNVMGIYTIEYFGFKVRDSDYMAYLRDLRGPPGGGELAELGQDHGPSKRGVIFISGGNIVGRRGPLDGEL